MNRSGETFIEQAYFEQNPLFRKQKKFVSKIALSMARFSAFMGVIVLVVLYLPSLWYSVISGGQNLSALIFQTAREGTEYIIRAESQVPEKVEYQPRLDNSLPFENSISIPSIGVETYVFEARYEDYEEALKQGVWRVPDAGDPFDRGRPTILVAHRFGYLRWNHAFRLKNSFYSLPKVKEGDMVEIVWRQRKYFYEIYGESKGTEIEDYNADLILYTCESLNSPVRIFRYARLLEI